MFSWIIERDQWHEMGKWWKLIWKAAQINLSTTTTIIWSILLFQLYMLILLRYHLGFSSQGKKILRTTEVNNNSVSFFLATNFLVAAMKKQGWKSLNIVKSQRKHMLDTSIHLASLLTLVSLGNGLKHPPGIFCFITFYELTQISWNLVTFPKIYLALVFWIFFQHSNWFLQHKHFFTTRCYFLCMSSVRIMNISLAVLVVFESRWYRENLFQQNLNPGFQFSLPKNGEISSSRREGQIFKFHRLVLSKT